MVEWEDSEWAGLLASLLQTSGVLRVAEEDWASCGFDFRDDNVDASLLEAGGVLCVSKEDRAAGGLEFAALDDWRDGVAEKDGTAGGLRLDGHGENLVFKVERVCVQ
jgi:hypothetical protein